MTAKIFAKLVLIIITAGVAITVGLLYTTESQNSDMYQAYLDRNTNSLQTSPKVTYNDPRRGVSDSDLESETEINIPGVPEDDGTANELDTTNYIDVAKYIAKQFTGTNCTSGTHYAPYEYSSTVSVTIDACGADTIRTHHDCSSFVSSFVTAIGKHSGGYFTSSWVFNNHLPGWSQVNADTFADCYPGDIFVISGHVGVVVAKDDTKIYFGDAGYCPYIKKTAEQGYYKAFNLTDSVRNWRPGKAVKIFRK